MTPQDIEAVANGAMAGIVALRAEALRLAASVASPAAPASPSVAQGSAVEKAIQALRDAARRTNEISEKVQYNAAAMLLEIAATPSMPPAPAASAQALGEAGKVDIMRAALERIALYRAVNGDDWPARQAKDALLATQQPTEEKKQ